MIVNWKKQGLKVIPAGKGTGQGLLAEKIYLLPGHNKIDDDVWNRVRPHLENQIKSGQIVEVKAKVEETEEEVPVLDSKGEPELDTNNKPKTSKKKKKVAKGVDIKDIEKDSFEEAVSLVKDTFNIDTLMSWKSDASDALRNIILDQIKIVESGKEQDTES